MQSNQLPALDVEFGNAGDLDTSGTGWFVGFSDWAKKPPAHLRHVPVGELAAGLCVKWFSHPAGNPNGEPKPLSDGRTMSILVSPASEFRIEFSATADFASQDILAHTLRRHGDFVIWGSGVFHCA
ncbi:hypothetical protein [Variovorax sp. OV700]|jgi:hypothetical protein|uniref:hypothetical protein n=1 Tax=Variovorax sp. OV700 TaxID=1882826 RepID=UPI00088EA21D|nr:hypothetical protein [Variovorax sp. OV700]SDJ51780.1 hypothetical protein SAMN05444748_11516 [Variovorax sp. OV700]